VQRLVDDRGAVSVVVALLMVPLIGLAAISLDVAGLWAKRQQLQIGADAAALAIAQDCGRGSCGSPAQTAQSLAQLNINDGTATATLLNSVTVSSGTVTVRTSGIRQHLFAPILGVNQTTVTAQATAAWGAPTGGTAVLPLAFSWCEFQAQTGGGIPSGTTTRIIKFTKTSNTTCTGPSNNVVPGGFGWLTVNSGTCNTQGTAGGTLLSSPGDSPPSGCSSADFAALQNRTALLPIFDVAGGTGNNAWYRLYGYAAFTITGYYFAGQYSWNSAGCSGNDRCIKGYFTRFVDLSDAFTYSTSAPQLGADVVRLTN
jgi:Flp pilus assembly protein TadG